MPDPDKFKVDLQNHQKDAGHRLADVVQYLKASGWSHRTKGSHEISTKPGMPMVNLQPEKDGKAKDYQIRQLRKTLFPEKLKTRCDVPKNNTIRDYRTTLLFDSKRWIAEIPAIPFCSADGLTPAEAFANLEETFAVMKEAHAEDGTELPQPAADLPITVRALSAVASLLKITHIAKLAGISPQTLHSKLDRGGELKLDEARKIHQALSSSGIMITSSMTFDPAAEDQLAKATLGKQSSTAVERIVAPRSKSGRVSAKGGRFAAPA